MDDQIKFDPADERDYAWAAGYVDGEGCFCAYMQNKGGPNQTFTVSLTAASIDRVSLDKLKHLFGGAICGPYKRGKNKEHYTYTITGQRVILAAKKMLPYLTVKRERAELVLGLEWTYAFGTRPVTDSVREYRDSFIVELKRLNNCGKTGSD